MIVSDQEFTYYLKNETGATDSDEIAAAHATGEEAVTRHCGGSGWRTFDLTAATATARLYVPQSCEIVRVHDFCTLTDLVISNNGTVLTSDQYQLEPVNGYDVTGFPYEQIRLLSGAWSIQGAKATVSVTARWGWTACPSAAGSAVKLIGKDYITGRTSKFGFTETSIGAVQGGRNWLALNALASLRRVESFGLA